MFERPHHQRIARVLASLDADALLKHQCLFGGGTAIVLAGGEYRESVDVDFICSSVEGYREIRSRVHAGGIQALMARPVEVLREPRIDQYGVRCALAVDGTPIKFEIVFEGRIALSDPLPQDRVCGVWALTLEDRVATKLMANSDRWADDSVYSRDLIDLAMVQEPLATLPAVGVQKALRAYGLSVIEDAEKARARLFGREGRLAACMKALRITLGHDEVRTRIEALAFPSTPDAAGHAPRSR